MHHAVSIKSLWSSFKTSSCSLLKPTESFLVSEFRVNEHGRLLLSLCTVKTIEVRHHAAFKAPFPGAVLETLGIAADKDPPGFVSHLFE